MEVAALDIGVKEAIDLGLGTIGLVYGLDSSFTLIYANSGFDLLGLGTIPLQPNPSAFPKIGQFFNGKISVDKSILHNVIEKNRRKI